MRKPGGQGENIHRVSTQTVTRAQDQTGESGAVRHNATHCATVLMGGCLLLDFDITRGRYQ